MFVMNINRRIIRSRLRSLALAVVTLSLLIVGSFGSASAMGVSGLLGVVPGFPQIDGSGTDGQGASYAPTGGGAGLLTLTSTPNIYLSDPGSFAFINDGILTMSAFIDSAGNSPADITIFSGSAGALGSPLLIADIISFGLENTNSNPGGTDRADFLLDPVGGSILSDPNWIAGSLAAMTMTLEKSTYNGNLDEPWKADRVKFVVGQSPIGLPEPATFPLVLAGLAGLWVWQRRSPKVRI